MKKYKCLIVDDESLAQDLIEAHLEKIPSIQIVKKCHTAMDALQILNEEHIDLMFLDIEMPDLSGIELLKSIDHPPHTIFTTAYAEYALESYELNVVDYLLKPILFHRLFKAVSKVLSMLNNEAPIQTCPSRKDAENDYIFVKSDYKATKIKLNDIIYIESLQKYVRFHLKEKKVMSLMSLSSLLNILPSQQFMRCQKSYIVNINEIEVIEGNQLIMSTNAKIPISKSIKADLIKKVDKNNLL